MVSSSQLLNLQENIRNPPLLCHHRPQLEAGGRTKAKRATSWAAATTVAVGEESLQSKLINRQTMLGTWQKIMHINVNSTSSS